MYGTRARHLLTLLLGCAASAHSADQVIEVQDEPRHHVVFENPFVRILEVDIPPGDTSLFHRHRRTNLFVVMGDAVRSTQILGSDMSPVGAVKQGDFGLMRVEGEGVVHRVSNPGRTSLRFTDIELLKPTGSSMIAASTIRPVAETESYRVYRIDVAPGETSPPMTLGPGVHVYVAGARLRQIGADGTEAAIETAPHAWQWHESGAYRLRNAGSSSAELIEIELK